MLIDTGLTAHELMLAARFAGWEIEMSRLQAWCKPPLSGGDVAITIPEMAALLWAVERMQRVLQAGYTPSGDTRERACRHCGRGYQLTGYSVGETAVDELYCQCGELLQRVTGDCVWGARHESA
ncbi:hypothetical protein QWZ03_06915 [Chitinimonas viridis]|uniref:Uncharacterized protein n=1 Tax=Chitinimonas viridis TaxID=664880 RepID=A0ABT8B4S0_9NEIS|nr:hypothetical protein [Chitinimonas viridis]MDN3576494.1 hypothetical protein [Chitinimonas viridis]